LYIVISAIKLGLFLFGGTFYFIGSGWNIIFPILKIEDSDENLDISRIIPIVFMGGLIVNLGVSLLVQSLSLGLFIGAFLSLVGWSRFFYGLYQQSSARKIVFGSANWWIGVSFVLLLFLGRIMSTPISGWDARSIWFFHAKMIYYAKSMGLAAGWQAEASQFSHVDYPKLLSLIAAQITHIAGFWNEYLPKLALFFILIPAIMLLLRVSIWRFSFVSLFLLVPISFHNVMWNGYMDGLLALYVALAVLFLGRYLSSEHSIDLFSGILSMIVLVYLKNEGILAFLVILSLTIVFLFLQKRPKLKDIFSSFQFKSSLFLSVGLLPMLIWEVYKRYWGLSNDLEIGTNSSFIMLSTRITDGSYRFIFENFYEQLEPALLLFGIVFFAFFIWKIKFPKSAYLPLSFAFFYTIGMSLIYFLTPHDLYWHIKTSVGRTLLSANAALFIGIYFVLSDIEEEYILNYFIEE
jgi:hypothetical protein